MHAKVLPLLVEVFLAPELRKCVQAAQDIGIAGKEQVGRALADPADRSGIEQARLLDGGRTIGGPGFEYVASADVVKNGCEEPVGARSFRKVLAIRRSLEGEDE